MPLWTPPAHIVESPARWEANPDRSTFFLQALVDAMRDGVFKQSPTVAAYTEISKMFWMRYNVYHTPKQFKNYYGKCKIFWGNVTWARGCTGIGWDDGKKMILASQEWWQTNQERKGIMQLKDRPINDYDLLETLFASQRVEARYAYSPYQPIPLTTSDEGSGDSEDPNEGPFYDPLLEQPFQGQVSMSKSYGQKRKKVQTQKPKRKKSKGTEMSPITTKVTHVYNVLQDAKERRRRIMFEGSGAGDPMSVVAPNTSTKLGSPSPSPTINSPCNMEKCMTIFRHLLKIPPRTDLFQHGSDILAENPDLQVVFLSFTQPEDQMYWLQRKVQARLQGNIGGVDPQTGHDLNSHFGYV